MIHSTLWYSPYWAPCIRVAFTFFDRIPIGDKSVVDFSYASVAAAKQIQTLATLRIGFDRLLQTFYRLIFTVNLFSERFYAMEHPSWKSHYAHSIKSQEEKALLALWEYRNIPQPRDLHVKYVSWILWGFQVQRSFLEKDESSHEGRKSSLEWMKA